MANPRGLLGLPGYFSGFGQEASGGKQAMPTCLNEDYTLFRDCQVWGKVGREWIRPGRPRSLSTTWRSAKASMARAGTARFFFAIGARWASRTASASLARRGRWT